MYFKWLLGGRWEGGINWKTRTDIYTILHMKEYIIRNAWLEEEQAGIKIAGRNINNLRYADDTTLMAESEEGLKTS